MKWILLVMGIWSRNADSSSLMAEESQLNMEVGSLKLVNRLDLLR